MNEPLDMDEQNRLNEQNAELRVENARLRNEVRYWKSVAEHARAYLRGKGAIMNNPTPQGETPIFRIGDRIYYNYLHVGDPFWITLGEYVYYPKRGLCFRYLTDQGEPGVTSLAYLYRPYVVLGHITATREGGDRE